MSDEITLKRPSIRDEDWRYSDKGFLQTADITSLQAWRSLEIPAGESHFEYSHKASPENTNGTVDRLRVKVGRGARLAIFQIIESNKYQRSELEVTLHDGAHFEFGGITIGGGKATQEFVTRVIHKEPNATSNQMVRAVHWGSATGNFLGRIEVLRDAQKTNAAQNFRALLLEKGALANTKPELEIFADDVQCAHGAAIGQIDEMASFYMASRGIDPMEARKLLVQAFVGDALTECADEKVREYLMQTAMLKLEEALI